MTHEELALVKVGECISWQKLYGVSSGVLALHIPSRKHAEIALVKLSDGNYRFVLSNDILSNNIDRISNT